MPWVYNPARSQPEWHDDPTPAPVVTPTTSSTRRTPTPGQDAGSNPIVPLDTAPAIGTAVTSKGVSAEKWLSDNATWLMVILTGVTIIVMLLVVIL